MSPGLVLHLLGPPQIDLDGKSIHLERRKSLALLSCLAVEGGQHQRDFLSSLLWPDINQSNAFKNLRQILTRKVLGAMVEVYEDCELMRKFYHRIAKATEGWNGENPVRSL